MNDGKEHLNQQNGHFPKNIILKFWFFGSMVGGFIISLFGLIQDLIRYGFPSFSMGSFKISNLLGGLWALGEYLSIMFVTAFVIGSLPAILTGIWVLKKKIYIQSMGSRVKLFFIGALMCLICMYIYMFCIFVIPNINTKHHFCVYQTYENLPCWVEFLYLPFMKDPDNADFDLGTLSRIYMIIGGISSIICGELFLTTLPKKDKL